MALCKCARRSRADLKKNIFFQSLPYSFDIVYMCFGVGQVWGTLSLLVFNRNFFDFLHRQVFYLLYQSVCVRACVRMGGCKTLLLLTTIGEDFLWKMELKKRFSFSLLCCLSTYLSTRLSIPSPTSWISHLSALCSDKTRTGLDGRHDTSQ